MAGESEKDEVLFSPSCLLCMKIICWVIETLPFTDISAGCVYKHNFLVFSAMEGYFVVNRSPLPGFTNYWLLFEGVEIYQ